MTSYPSVTAGERRSDPALKTQSADPALGETIERLVEAFRPGTESSAGEALPIVVRATRAAGAALCEWNGRGEPRAIAACGSAGRAFEEIDVARFFIDAYRRRDPETFCATALIDKDRRYACGALRRGGKELLTLVIGGDGQSRFEDLALLRVFLRMADSVRPEPPARGDAESEARAARAGDFPPDYIPSRSPAMAETYRQMRLVAPADFPLLVLGETGVGKEHIVRILHTWSRRRRGPFVAVNCAAIPDTLLEAEMFGIGRGVASGVMEREGKFVQADGGTLFLDEIGELPLPMQAKLLRVLQDHEVTPVGARPVKVDMRVVAATNADLEQKMRDGRFRSDLYYRIAGSVIRVPPLRECQADVTGLVEHFLRKFAAELGRSSCGLTLRGLEMLTRYPWPGNVRELEHEMRRLVHLSPAGEVIDPSLISEQIAFPQRDEPLSSSLDLQTRVAELERQLIEQALRRSRGNRSTAARLLGLSRNGLAMKMARLELD